MPLRATTASSIAWTSLFAGGVIALGIPLAHASPPWQQLGPSGGRIDAIAVRDSLRYALAGQRLFRSDDSGATWHERPMPADCIFPGYPLTSLRVRADGDVFLHCDPVMRSKDGGMTWSRFSPPGLDNELAFAPASVTRAAMLGEDYTPFVAVTVDDGREWTFQFAEPGARMPTRLRYERDAGNVLIGVGTNLIQTQGAGGTMNQYPLQAFRSVDNGRTWTVTGTLVAASENIVCFEQQFQVDAANRQYVRAACGFFRSTDGTAWERSSTFPLEPADLGTIAVNPVAAGQVFAYAGMELHESHDAGSTWQVREPPPGYLLDLDFGPDGTPWMATDAGVFVRDLGTSTWRFRSDGLHAYGLSIVEPAPGGGVLTALQAPQSPSSRDLQSPDGGHTWSAFAPIGERVIELARNASDPASLLALTESRRFLGSRDGGTSWEVVAVDPLLVAGTNLTGAKPVGPQPGVVWGLYTTCVPSGFGGCLQRVLGVTRSTDGGRTWPTATPLEPSSPGLSSVVPSVDPDVAMASMFTTVHVTRDAGVTWRQVFGATNATVVADPADAARWYLHGYGIGLHGTSDFGATWTRLADPPMATTYFDLLVDAATGSLYAVGAHAELAVSADRGATWRRVVEPDGLLRISQRSPRLGTESPATIYAAGAQGVLKLVVPNADARAIEYWHAGLDHYFVTAFPTEIALLDGNRFPGWVRSGESFAVLPAGTAPSAGSSPVCRYYGRFPAGLDSHFYSASPAECTAVGTRFGDIWQLESSDVFAAWLPEAATGNCPQGTSPIFRLFNGRPDVNHRYVGSLSLRETMIARGWVPEGYGPLGVGMCAPAS